MSAPVSAVGEAILGIPADSITAVSTAILAFGTVFLIYPAWKQLNEAKKIYIESNTLRVCERYISDSVIHAASRRIWDASASGTKYGPEIYNHDLIIVLNYLDGIAVGVKQGVFSAEIVKDHMESTFVKAVDVIIPQTIGNFKDYEAIQDLRNGWKPPSITYKRR